jgi:predicted histidine transporter YuiF (NhaC family)
MIGLIILYLAGFISFVAATFGISKLVKSLRNSNEYGDKTVSVVIVIAYILVIMFIAGMMLLCCRI